MHQAAPPTYEVRRACYTASSLQSYGADGSATPERVHQRSRWRSLACSEEAERIDVVADEQVLGLLVVVEHHLVGFATDTGLLVATERGVRRV